MKIFRFTQVQKYTTFTTQVTFVAILLLLSAVACTATNRETSSALNSETFQI